MISELPDDILISILSRLTVQDATATSILSTRWRHLCTYITHLHFQPLKLRKRIIALTPAKEKNNFHPLKGSTIVSHPSRFLNKRMKTPQEMQKEFSTSVNWINHVLDCYNGGRVLKEFRLRMPFATQVDVEKWLEFAMSREVETLHIQLDSRDPSGGYLTGEFLRNNFCDCWCCKCRKTGIYTMKNGGYGWHLKDYHEYPIQKLILRNNGCLCFTSLKILYLDNVDLHAIELELLISNCVVLETLSITHSRLLENVVTIRGPSLKLKHLKIRHCSTVIQIHDLINLVSFSFTCSGWENVLRMDERSSMVVENVPVLTEIDCYHKSHVELLSTVLSCCLHQLLKLTLEIKPSIIQNYGWRYSLPKLMNLKHLVLNLDMMLESCLLTLAPLVEASPLLEKLDIVFSWWTPEFRNREPFGKKLWEHPHNNLKQVRFFDYLGSPYEFEFALYIFKNALNLEEFVVEPCATVNAPSYEYDKEAFRRKASALARQQFQATVPKSVKLVIL